MQSTAGRGSALRAYRLASLVAVLAGLLLIPSDTALAVCVSPLKDGSFEGQRSRFVSAPWVAEGRAGIDIRRGLSYSGANNAWARNNSGWNGIRQRVWLYKNTVYTLKAYVRSANVQAGYFGFRYASQRPVREIKFGSTWRGYRQLRVSFRPTSTGRYYVFTGFWAPGSDAWIQIDSVRVEAACNDVVLNPAPY